MDAEQRLLIDGELVAAASGRTYNNFSPVSELAIGLVSDAGHEDMDRAIASARRVFDHSQWSRDHEFRHHCLTQPGWLGLLRISCAISFRRDRCAMGIVVARVLIVMCRLVYRLYAPSFCR